MRIVDCHRRTLTCQISLHIVTLHNLELSYILNLRGHQLFQVNLFSLRFLGGKISSQSIAYSNIVHRIRFWSLPWLLFYGLDCYVIRKHVKFVLMPLPFGFFCQKRIYLPLDIFNLGLQILIFLQLFRQTAIEFVINGFIV